MEKQDSITLQLHYFLDEENLHSMNAKVHNECEKQFIHAILLLNKYLDEPLELVVFAKREGGVEDYYKVLIENPLVLIILTSFIASSITQFFNSNFSPKISITEESKNKLDTLIKIKESIKAGMLSSVEFDYITENDKDLKKMKSNFFRSAKKDKRINRIEVEAIKKNGIPIFEKIAINSSDFDNCISPDEQKISENEIDAKIHIVAPVLLRGRKDYWKGIYNEESIEFRVSDKVFLENVYQHIIKFSNGTYINCSMKIRSITSLMDEAEKISRNVFKVLGCGDDEKFSTIYRKKNRSSQNTQEGKTPSLFAEID